MARMCAPVPCGTPTHSDTNTAIKARRCKIAAPPVEAASNSPWQKIMGAGAEHSGEGWGCAALAFQKVGFHKTSMQLTNAPN